jgi:hypothetical protein
MIVSAGHSISSLTTKVMPTAKKVSLEDHISDLWGGLRGSEGIRAHDPVSVQRSVNNQWRILTNVITNHSHPEGHSDYSLKTNYDPRVHPVPQVIWNGYSHDTVTRRLDLCGATA